MRHTRRSYSRDFKISAVKKVLAHGLSYAEVGRDLDINDGMLRNRKRKKGTWKSAFVGAIRRSLNRAPNDNGDREARFQAAFVGGFRGTAEHSNCQFLTRSTVNFFWGIPEISGLPWCVSHECLTSLRCHLASERGKTRCTCAKRARRAACLEDSESSSDSVSTQLSIPWGL